MGLDMYAYRVKKEHVVNDFEFNSDQDPAYDIAYWRKFNALHGWMERLWEEKGRPGAESDTEMFNGIELELDWTDIENLEEDIREDNLPGTTGFFFGDDSDDYYREQDLEFVKQAKADLFLGLKVYYNSSW